MAQPGVAREHGKARSAWITGSYWKILKATLPSTNTRVRIMLMSTRNCSCEYFQSCTCSCFHLSQPRNLYWGERLCQLPFCRVWFVSSQRCGLNKRSRHPKTHVGRRLSGSQQWPTLSQRQKSLQRLVPCQVAYIWPKSFPSQWNPAGVHEVRDGKAIEWLNCKEWSERHQANTRWKGMKIPVWRYQHLVESWLAWF